MVVVELTLNRLSTSGSRIIVSIQARDVKIREISFYDDIPTCAFQCCCIPCYKLQMISTPHSDQLSDFEVETFMSHFSANAAPVPTPLNLPSSSVSIESTSATQFPGLSGNRSSWVWRHNKGGIKAIKLGGKTGKDQLWVCSHCGKEMIPGNSTSWISRHLIKDHHQIQGETPHQIEQKGTIQRAFASAAEDNSKRRRISAIISQQELKQLLIRWTASCSIPFRMCENLHFRNLLFFLNEDVNEALPQSANTVRKWTIEAYNSEKEKVKQSLQSAQSAIHITMDLWTSPNQKALLGVVGHCIGENGDLRESVLALREVKGRHTGENQALVVLEVLKEYGIASKLGYFMMDNAESNNTMIQHLANGMSPTSRITGRISIHIYTFFYILTNYLRPERIGFWSRQLQSKSTSTPL
jgi:hypothetical protein